LGILVVIDTSRVFVAVKIACLEIPGLRVKVVFDLVMAFMLLLSSTA
jgi:hypothetical protein